MRQPRVPEYRESEGVGAYIRNLIRFLKDFCMDAWSADKSRGKEIESVRAALGDIKIPEVSYPVTSVNEKTGAVVLKAADVGALGKEETAADSEKLGGRTWTQRLLEAYPIGSIYLSASETSPASLFGGVWEQLTDRFLIGAGTSYEAGSTGGRTSASIGLQHLPTHNHVVRGVGFNVNTVGFGQIAFQDDGNIVIYKNGAAKWTSGSGGSYENGTYQGTIGAGAMLTDNAGESAEFSIMPPYLSVYMWKRVS